MFTGYTRDGGYATHAVADARYCFPLPERATMPSRAAAVRRADRLAQLPDGGRGRARSGSTASAPPPTSWRRSRAWQGRRVYAFTRAGDTAAQAFARSLGAVWAGGSDEAPPEPLDAAIIFAPVGALVPAALAAVKKGGRVVCGGIHMSDIPSFPYRLLWEERTSSRSPT